jgi:hypothetical protein
VITKSGSYYLMTNLTGISGANGVTVQANGVTIDLRGFSLAGAAGSLNGIVVPSAQSGLTIYGGTVTGWGAAGINATNDTSCRFSDLILLNNGSHGLMSGASSIVKDCVAAGNSGDGVELLSYCLAENNNCQSNTLNGLHVLGNASRVEANHAGKNGGAGFEVDGIQNLIVKNSAVNNVTASYSVATNNDYGEILASPGSGFSNFNPWANFASIPAPTCSDGIKNGNETDVDCGGGTCTACVNGKQCLTGTDCVSGSCSGGVCVTLLANGATCSSGSQCISGNCADGVCCNTPCVGTCQACIVSLTGSPNGICANVHAGMNDPNHPCSSSVCNGSGACQ